MGYKIKIQKVVREKSCSYYLNVPIAFAEAVNLKKGEELEWLIEDRNTFILKRVKPHKSFSGKD